MWKRNIIQDAMQLAQLFYGNILVFLIKNNFILIYKQLQAIEVYSSRMSVKQQEF